MSKQDEIFDEISFGTFFGNSNTFKEYQSKQPSRVLSHDIDESYKPSKSLDFFNNEENSLIESDEDDEYNEMFLSNKEVLRKFKINVMGLVELPDAILNFKKQLKVRKYLYKNVVKEFELATPVQMMGMPVMLKKMECLIAAPTGSGKTLTYIVPVLNNLFKAAKEMKNNNNIGVRAVVIAPTRVLSDQITREFNKYASGKPFVIRNIVKNRNINIQKFKESKYTDIIVSTPNRLVQLLRKNIVSLSTVEHLIIDEVDRLFDLGLSFIEQIDEIVTACSNPNVQRALFSATIPFGVEHLAKTFLRNPVTLSIGIKNTGSETITQKLLYATNEDGKLMKLSEIFRNGGKEFKPPILIFVNNAAKAEEVYKRLLFDNYRIDYISAKRNENKIKEIIENYRIGRIWGLISTDIMARGLDVKGISCVINYDFPRSEVEYIHRIGRTGRAGMKGTALTFFTNSDISHLSVILTVMRKNNQIIPSSVEDLYKQSNKKHNNNNKRKREKTVQRKSKKRKLA